MVFLALARGWAKDTFRANLMAYFFVLNLISILAYWQLKLLTPASITLAAAALLPALLIALLGFRIRLASLKALSAPSPSLSSSLSG